MVDESCPGMPGMRPISPGTTAYWQVESLQQRRLR